MQRKLHKIFSPAVGREMRILSFGYGGIPVVTFPTYGTPYHEYEDNSTINTLAHLIDDGQIRLYCLESIDHESWLHNKLDPHWRAVRHHAFQDFVMNNVVPLVRGESESAETQIALMGADLGAFHAVNFALKFPDIFYYALGLSGLYDADALCHGTADSLDYYYNNPMAFVANLEGEDLEHVREHTHLTLVCGQGEWDERSRAETERLAKQLEEKKISHDYDLWGHDVTPDWHWWNKQADYHLEKLTINN